MIVLVVLFLLLRGCGTDQTGGGGGSSAETSPTAGAELAISIENKVYAALRAKTFSKNKMLNSWVYIAQATTNGDGTVTIYLTNTTTELRKSLGIRGPAQLTQVVLDTVLAAVPEVKKLIVLDSNGTPMGTVTR